MPLLRHMLSALAILLLTLVIGVGDAAHALSQDSSGGHCAEHMVQGDMTMALTDPAVEPAGMPSGAGTYLMDDGCCSAFCQVLVFLPRQSDAPVPEPATLTTWQIDDLSALEGPESPDRPPIL